MGEVGLIAVVALLVLGPERLPGAARTAGALLRRARASWQNVQQEIERELAAEDLAILLVEHDLRFAARVASRMVALERGAKIADGAPAEVRRHPAVARAYLGDE